ncbi:MAG: DNA (cytosine-5-)-methyltransferase, partial [Candidatus Gastranaerophilaceae bacterium]
MSKLKVVTLFSGIGAQESALDKLGIPYEIVGYSEIDKFAIKSYTALYGEQPALGDITQIEELPECDLCTYSFPCTDISVGGDKKGLIDENGNKTRSGLLLDVERLLDVAKEKNKLPKILLLENVKNLVGKKFKPDFDRWLGKLEELGYVNFWKVLNAKDYGVPQNRERVFVISFLKELNVNEYEFPAPFKLEKRMVDILERNVPESYYLSQQIIDKIKRSNFHSEADRVITGDYSNTLRARDFKDPLCVEEPFIAA